MNALNSHLEATWASLADRVAMMIGAYGGPADLFRWGVLRRIVRQHILQWLAPLEALARRLLALEASRLPRPNILPFVPRPGRIATRCADACPRQDSEDPAQWRVRFALWPEGHARNATPAPIDSWSDRGVRDNAIPIARRIEALLRIVQDRNGALTRMARLLAARRATAFAAFSPYRTRQRVGPADTLLRETQALLECALADTS